MSEPLLRVRDLHVGFPVRRGLLGREVARVRAVDGVSFEIARGATLGLVGESGSGKSTTARAILRLVEPSAGSIRLGETELRSLGGRALRRERRRMQMVFQDPYASLDPRMTVFDAIAEPLRVHARLSRAELERRVAELANQTGLDASFLRRYPHEMSGGQRQRVGIARAVALRPELVVLDEPVSALDVSVQAQILNLLAELQAELGLSYLFVAHDLAVVRHLADEVAVMYLGRIVEHAPVDELFEDPRHPYTRALLSAVPVPDPVVERSRKRVVLEGEVPSPLAPPSGCSFHPRCPEVIVRCRRERPPLVALGRSPREPAPGVGAGGARRVACWVATADEPGAPEA